MLDRLDRQIDDKKIVEEVNKVDWQRVAEHDAARFGLSVGIFRDAAQTWKLYRCALGTIFGGVFTMVVLVAACLLTKTGTSFALGLVIVHQMTRAVVLCWRAHESKKSMSLAEADAVNSARQLAQLYPAHEMPPVTT